MSFRSDAIRIRAAFVATKLAKFVRFNNVVSISWTTGRGPDTVRSGTLGKQTVPGFRDSTVSSDVSRFSRYLKNSGSAAGRTDFTWKQG